MFERVCSQSSQAFTTAMGAAIANRDRENRRCEANWTGHIYAYDCMENQFCIKYFTSFRLPHLHIIFSWDGKYGIRDNYKLIISVFAAWRL